LLRTRLLLVAGAMVLGAVAITLVLGAHRIEVWVRIVRLLHDMQALAATAPLAAALFYILVYAALVALCLPLGPAMSLTGGVVFGAVPGIACALLAITLGCMTCFLSARTAFGAAIGARRGALLASIQPRLERDGFLALLALRLAPVVPSWLLNLASGLAGMRLLPFASATFVGVLPATAIFASTGAGLGGALTDQAPPGLDILLRPQILLPLLALSSLALLPVLLRTLRR
jgi:uncharacterized membrane protein YdjX (TVP38/TMEM64 family)